MEVVIAAALNAVSYIVIAVLGIVGGRRLVGPNQDKLIATLKDLVDVQEAKIKTLEEGNKIRDEKISSLDKQVIELKALTIFQAKEIERLTEQMKVGKG
jgi:hypothetical protein